MVAECPPTVPIKHGTTTGFVNRGCRCDVCRDFWNAYNRERRAIRGDSLRVLRGRINTALSILNHREPSEETCQLAARALLGDDVIAEAAGE